MTEGQVAILDIRPAYKNLYASKNTLAKAGRSKQDHMLRYELAALRYKAIIYRSGRLSA